MLAPPKDSEASQRRNISRGDAAIKRAQDAGATATRSRDPALRWVPIFQASFITVRLPLLLIDVTHWLEDVFGLLQLTTTPRISSIAQIPNDWLSLSSFCDNLRNLWICFTWPLHVCSATPGPHLLGGSHSGPYSSGLRWAIRSTSYWPGTKTIRFARAMAASISA